MSNKEPWDIVTEVILPLAKRLEAASKVAYPAGQVSPLTLDDLKADFTEIRTYGDVADQEHPAHLDMFDRFKKVYYRRRNFLREQGLIQPPQNPSQENPD